MMRREYGAFDVAKFILSFFVCAVHTVSGILPIYPLARIAVPLFFLMSGYLFFSGIEGVNDESGKRKRLSRFAVRNVRLYAFWLAALLPITLILKSYQSDGPILGPLRFLVNLVLGSTFPASWYISALVIGVCILFTVRGRVGNTVLLSVSAALYVVCCFVGNYRGLFGENSLFVKIFVEYYPGTIYNSFPAGLLWLAVGKELAHRRDNKLSRVLYAVMSGVSLSLLFAEHCIISFLGCSSDNDCYFMLVPTCIFAFLFLRTFDKGICCGNALRKISTVVYCLHGGIASVFKLLFHDFCATRLGAAVLLLVAFTFSVAFALLILRLEKIKGFKWLRFAH